MKHFLTIMLVVFTLSSCANMILPPKLVQNGSVRNYTYAYIIPTSAINSTSTGGAVYNGFGYVGGNSTSINPSDAISGYLMKEGYIILPSLNPDLMSQTMIVSFGYLGKRSLGPFAYATNIMIQFRDASSYTLIESCEAEGCGESEADDYIKAINAGLNAIFH